ncbi:MAG: SRPBCC family protein [Gemmatimonadales bacterium]
MGSVIHAGAERHVIEAPRAGLGTLPADESPGYDLGPLPDRYLMRVLDERVVGSAVAPIFAVARDVERWPRLLSHYRYVRFRERRLDGGGLVEMSANRPFGPAAWPTWWLSRMQVVTAASSFGAGPAIRFRHVEGITAGMEVEWSFLSQGSNRTLVRIVHLWLGPSWPLIGGFAARAVIGPVFVHGIASRTLAGLAAVAESQHDGPGSMKSGASPTSGAGHIRPAARASQPQP